MSTDRAYVGHGYRTAGSGAAPTPCPSVGSGGGCGSATGKTAQHVWRQALEQGRDVTAFARSIGKIDRSDSSVRVVQGDITDAESVASAVAGHDAAIVALGSNGLRDKATLTAGTRNVVDGMTQHHVGRLVVVSAAGVGESWGQISWLARLMFRNAAAKHLR